MAYFPLFVSLEHKRVVVIGGGKIAARRILKLLPFECDITLISPSAQPVLQELAQQKALRWEERAYVRGDCAGAFLVLAATDDTIVNRAVCREAKAANIPVNSAENQADCDFYFPGLVQTNDLVIGVTANGRNHSLVKETTAMLQEVLEGGRKDALS